MTSLKEEARKARLAVLKMIYDVQSCHLGSCMSSVEILTYLFERLNVTKELADDEDKIIISKGWIAALFYYFLDKKGIIPAGDIRRFYQPGEKQYLGLLEPSVRGVWAAGGSVAMGLPFSVGYALDKKWRGQIGRVICLESDGGMHVGMVYESLMLAAKYKLDNLVLIIDANGWSATGRADEVLPIEPLAVRLASFNWAVEEIDGHDFEAIHQVLSRPRDRPLAIIARTIKAKGIPAMEDMLRSHYNPPTKEEYEEALALL